MSYPSNEPIQGGCSDDMSQSGGSFGSLLRRYLFPTGLLERPAGDIIAVHAVIERNNSTLRRWMPHYARVHSVLAGTLVLGAGSAEAAEAPLWLVAGAAVPAVGEVVLAIAFVSIAIALRLK